MKKLLLPVLIVGALFLGGCGFTGGYSYSYNPLENEHLVGVPKQDIANQLGRDPREATLEGQTFYSEDGSIYYFRVKFDVEPTSGTLTQPQE